MMLNEFNALIMEDGVQVDKETFDILEEHYMSSKSNKFDYVYDLMIAFKDWFWKRAFEFTTKDRNYIFKFFIIYELGSYKF